MQKNKKISVAFFLPSLEPGGTERNVVNLVNTIDRGVYDVSLVLGKMEGDFLRQVNKDIPIININAPYSLGLFFALVAYLKKNKPDILVSAFPRINIICIIATMYARTGAKIIITEHSVFSLLPVIAKTFWRRTFARFCMPLLAKLVYPHADAIICVSKGIAKDLVDILNGSKKISVIYNPVVSQKIYQLAEEPLTHQWFFNSDIPVILAAGRLVACKDYPTLLRSFALVVEKKPSRLVVLGRGPEQEKLRTLAKSLDIDDQVAFLGFQENPYKYMKGSSIFVASSLQEGFGNAIIEAMACGIPVVSTDCPTGPAEIIQHGVNGMLVAMEDPKALAETILDVLNNNELRIKLSSAGRQRAGDFSVENSVLQYEKVFFNLKFSS